MIEERRAALLAWYDRHRRPLPWRDTSDPYAILVSEVMAQQTQISRVAEHYQTFVARFPTVEVLAAAPLAAVLRTWSGLGYNRRARYLHGAARAIAADGWPQTAAGLRRLPGVGPYTAAAVACFAFGEPVAAVDTNVKRVLSRWEGHRLSGTGLAARAGGELDRSRPGDWNQAVMDLGARLCTPREPGCGDCPVRDWCRDPQVYAPPPRQPRFEGSMREARGAVVKALVAVGAATRADLARLTGLEAKRLPAALESLHADGLIRREGAGWALAEA